MTTSLELLPPTQNSESPNLRLLRRTFRSPSAVIGALILLVLLVASLAAPLLTDKDPNKINPTQSLKPPSLAQPMGTDNIGRDNWARFLNGGRLSLLVGVIAIAIGATAGITIGAVAGYFGGWIDSVLSWAMDVLISFPDLLLALAMIAVLGPGLINAMIAVGIAFIPGFARLTRSSVLSIREQNFVEAARALGASDASILLNHLLPNSLRPLLVLTTLSIGSAILTGAALSFLGLGAQPPTPEWGAMLNAGQKFVRQAWWLTVFPGLGIFLTILSLNLLGDAVSDAAAGGTGRRGA
jgi:peptide/nickel transport system permease protein